MLAPHHPPAVASEAYARVAEFLVACPVLSPRYPQSHTRDLESGPL